MQHEAFALDCVDRQLATRVATWTSNPACLAARAIGRRWETKIPVFRDEIENFLRHQVDNLCRLAGRRFPTRVPCLEHQDIPKQVLVIAAPV